MSMDSISDVIKAWLDDRKNNAIEPGAHLPAFAEPLVGVAAADDELFSFLKEDIGSDFYWTPLEAFSHAFPEFDVKEQDLSVITWILPQTENTRKAHRKAQQMPSIEWSRARHFGEIINEKLRSFVVSQFQLAGYRACAPALLPQWGRATSEKYGFASSWSERHAAHVCGLGTFGVSDGLISPAGKAVRVGSVIVNKRYPPTTRTYGHHNEWCLHHATGKCLICMKRCPAGAITREGHDKLKCKEYIRNVTAKYVEKEQLGVKVNSCGLCQVKVPCEARNPRMRKSSK